jgi:hypothetical protein
MSKLIKTHTASAKLGGGKLHQYSCGAIIHEASTLCGKAISTDNSGVGHNWRRVDADSLSGDVREILAGEIIDGGRESGKECIGGIWYRWA